MGNHAASDKRTAILQAALTLVAEHGFRGTTMALVARHSGASAGTIYHYFASKDELIHALYQAVKREFSQALLQGSPQHLPWPDHLKHIWLNAFRYYVDHPQAASFLEQYETSPYQGAPWHAGADDECTATIMQLVQQDLAHGLLADLPFAVLYELTLGVAVALARHQTAGTLVLDPHQQDMVASACCRAVARGA